MNKDFEELYINYIKNSEVILDDELKKSFISLLREKNIENRLEIWKNFKVNIESLSQLPKLANPFFIGYGNPKSDILFVGKEKAFDIYRNPELFFHESINNTLQWKLITLGSKFNDKIFDPRNPRKYHNFKIKANHTWGKYAKIIAFKNNLENDLLLVPEESQPTFFDFCFLTEINHLPSKYSVGKNLVHTRKKLLKDQFYKKFKNVVIGAKGYLTDEQIVEIFNVTKHPDPKILGKKGKRRIQEITATLYSNENQQVIYCSQLSGATGWTNEAIENLARLLK